MDDDIERTDLYYHVGVGINSKLPSLKFVFSKISVSGHHKQNLSEINIFMEERRQ